METLSSHTYCSSLSLWELLLLVELGCWQEDRGEQVFIMQEKSGSCRTSWLHDRQGAAHTSFVISLQVSLHVLYSPHLFHFKGKNAPISSGLAPTILDFNPLVSI